MKRLLSAGAVVIVACAQPASSSNPAAAIEQPITVGNVVVSPIGPNVSQKTGWMHSYIGRVCAAAGIDCDTPWKKLPMAPRQFLLGGSDSDDDGSGEK